MYNEFEQLKKKVYVAKRKKKSTSFYVILQNLQKREGSLSTRILILDSFKLCQICKLALLLRIWFTWIDVIQPVTKQRFRLKVTVLTEVKKPFHFLFAFEKRFHILHFSYLRAVISGKNHRFLVHELRALLDRLITTPIQINEKLNWPLLLGKHRP